MNPNYVPASGGHSRASFPRAARVYLAEALVAPHLADALAARRHDGVNRRAQSGSRKRILLPDFIAEKRRIALCSVGHRHSALMN